MRGLFAVFVNKSSERTIWLTRVPALLYRNLIEIGNVFAGTGVLLVLELVMVDFQPGRHAFVLFFETFSLCGDCQFFHVPRDILVNQGRVVDPIEGEGLLPYVDVNITYIQDQANGIGNLVAYALDILDGGRAEGLFAERLFITVDDAISSDTVNIVTPVFVPIQPPQEDRKGDEIEGQ